MSAVQSTQQAHQPRTQPSDYILHRTLRQSIYGKVKLATLKSHPDFRVAVKISSLEHVRRRTNLEDPETETQVMRLLSAKGGHAHVLRLYDDFVQNNEQGIPTYHWQILEFCEKGELFDFIDAMQGRGVGEDLARHYFKQILSGVKFIHSNGIAHLDISPENVLRDHNDTLKIIDFGMARPLPNSGVFEACPANKPGKIAYMAPEIFEGKPFDGRSADVYSLGVVLFTLLVGFPPYSQPTLADKRFEMIYNGQLYDLMKMWGLHESISPAAMQLLQAVLRPQSRRLTFEQLEAHPWIRGFSKIPVALPSPIALPVRPQQLQQQQHKSFQPMVDLPAGDVIMYDAVDQQEQETKLMDLDSQQAVTNAHAAAALATVASVALLSPAAAKARTFSPAATVSHLMRV